MKDMKTKKGKMLVEAFDALFIMLLCFGTLLSAMLLTGDGIDGVRYSINYITLGITLLGLFIYLSFILPQSDKGLKVLINQIYDHEESTVNK